MNRSKFSLLSLGIAILASLTLADAGAAMHALSFGDPATNAAAAVAVFGMSNRVPPATTALGRYDVNRVNAVEALWSPLYDYGAPTADNYAAAGQTQIDFFQVPQGQSSKTLADTNMNQAGTLPNPQQFLVTNIQVLFWPATSLVARVSLAAAALDADFLKDVYQVSKSGYLKFFVGSKDYVIDAPLGVFPPMTGLTGFGTTNQTTTADMNGAEQSYARFAGSVYEITPIRLVSQQNFKVSLVWPTAVTISAAARIGVRLGGYLYRLSQ